ncbi:MAG: hypothetical protein DME25_11325, partial [Verrucomicrobia bacterium]
AIQLSCIRSSNSLVLSWPAAASSFVLESASRLTPPTTWTTVTNPPPQLVGDQKRVIVGLTNSSRFFRLRAQGP